MKKLLLLALLALSPLARAADTEPLAPDLVYKMSATAEPGSVTVHWDILKGYYLYQDKFRFVSQVTGIKLGKPQFPEGETHTDPYFGKQTIFHKGVSVSLPVTGVGKLDLDVTYQGCAEAGFCYPPQRKHVSLMLVAAAPVAAPATAAAPASSTAKVNPPDLEDLLAGNGDANDFPPPEQVFNFNARAKDQDTVEVTWQVTPGYYLYRQKFALKSDNPDVILGTPDFPQGEIKNDPYLGTSEIYTKDVDALIPVTRANGAGKFNLIASWQGCAEKGFCYPPQSRTVPIDLAAAGTLPAMGPAPEQAPVAEQDRLANLIKDGNLFWVFLSFIGFGMLLTFTPCVLPMVPIISGIIVGQGKKLTTGRAFVLSLTYVLAMAFAYAIAGVIVGLAGSNIQIALQNPWVLGGFALVFVLLSLSMFGFYELQMPSALQNWFNQHSSKQQGGAFAGVAIMGALSALICGPCITAPLVAALIFIGESGSAFRGGLALFALGLGMGVPLLIIGTSAGRLVPKAGAWMERVKHVFGVMMLAVAIWFVARVLPGPLVLVLWAALAIVCGVYLGALETHAPPRHLHKLWRGLGLLALLYGLILLVGAALGSDDPLKPLAPLASRGGMIGANAGTPGPQASTLPFKKIKTLADLDREVAAAAAAHTPVMLDFAADWCVSCKEMDHETYTDPAVRTALAKVVLLQADVTANDDDDEALYKRFGIFGPPSIMFFGPDGQELKAYRVVGFLGPQDFLKRLQTAFASN